MPGVVHHQASLLHLLEDVFGHAGIRVVRGSRLPPVSVPINPVNLQCGIISLHQAGHLLGLEDVVVFVAVIAHHANHVAPRPGILVFHVIDGLVHHDTRLRFRGHRETSDSQIHFVARQAPTLSIVQQPEIVLHDIAGHLAERIFRFVAQEIVIGIQSLGCLGHHTVVPHTIAEKEEIAGHVGFRLRPVVEHLHETAVSRGVRCSGRELIVNLVGTHDGHPQAVQVAVGFGQPFGLGLKLATGRNEDNHVHGSRRMQILVAHLSYIGRRRIVRIYVHRHILPRGIVHRHGVSIPRTRTLHLRHGLPAASQPPQLHVAAPVGIDDETGRRGPVVANIQPRVAHQQLAAVAQLQESQPGIHALGGSQSDLHPFRATRQRRQRISFLVFLCLVIFSRGIDAEVRCQ